MKCFFRLRKLVLFLCAVGLTISACEYSEPVIEDKENAIPPIINPASGLDSIHAGDDIFTSVPIENIGSVFEAKFKARVSSSESNALLGFSLGEASDFGDVAVAIRFNPDGKLDVRNGSSYESAQEITYTPGEFYHFKILVDPSKRRYDVYVEDEEDNEEILMLSSRFRTEQEDISELNHIVGWARNSELDIKVMMVKLKNNDVTEYPVSGFTLIKANIDSVLGPLSHGDSLDFEELGTHKLNIRADVVAGFDGSITFELNGPTSKIETVDGPIYTLFGYDNGDYKFGSGLHPGVYSLKVIPYVTYNNEPLYFGSETLEFIIYEEPEEENFEFFTIDYEADSIQDVFGQWWSTRHSAEKPYSVQESSGGHIYRFEVREGEARPGKDSGSDRAELSNKSPFTYVYGTDLWVSYAMKLENLEGVINNSRVVVGQWHGTAGSPPLAFRIRNGKYSIESITGTVGGQTDRTYHIPTEELNANQWYHVVGNMKFDANGGAKLRVWIDGQNEIDEDNFSMGYTNTSSTYWKFGIYRNTDENTQAIQFANMEVGTDDLSDRINTPLPIQP